MEITQEVRLAELLESFLDTRNYSLKICESLSDEDLQAQSMTEASPLKWHLAHTSWAFEAFVLKPFAKNYQVFDLTFEYLFNSYYNAIGAQFPREQRGLLTRPDRSQVMQYRQHVDKAITDLIQKQLSNIQNQNCINRLLLAINHEQQHQELMLTDLKHLLFINPSSPAYQPLEMLDNSPASEMLTFEQGLYKIGHQNEAFYYDNEGPLHDYYLPAFQMASSLVSNAEYLEFIQDGGYQNALLWLSEAWQNLSQKGQQAPHYWIKKQNQWYQYTLDGLTPLAPLQPVKHISYFEANAYACWRGKRLPTEQEWEVAARSQHPQLKQMFNQLWQWTSSSYNAYPGFKVADGAVGEYNGKFMVNQYVLRGGSFATPKGHIRASYRNFFYPDANWQFSGIRLAESC